MRNKLQNKNTERVDIRSYVLLSVVVAILGFIVAKDVSIPKTVILFFAGTAFLMLFYSSFRNPELSLLALTAYLPFSKILVGQFGAAIVGFNLTNILMLIVISGWILNGLQSKRLSFTRSSLNPVILLFCLWGLFSVVRGKLLYGSSYAFEDFFILFKRWVTPVFLYFIGLNMVKDKKIFRKVVFVIMLATFIVALMAARDYLNYGDRGSIEESRIGGVFEQPNMLGAFFVYNMFFFLGFFLQYWRSLKYWLLLIPFLACFRGIMVTFSRGAYLAFAFGLSMIVFFRNKFLFMLILFGLIFAVLNPAFLPEGMRQRMASTFGGEKVIAADIEEITDPSAGRRILIWKGAVEMIKEQPWFGFGYGTFTYIIGYYVPQIPGADAHNTYLVVAAEMGIPALIIFLLILILLIKNSRWLFRHSKDRYFRAFALGMLGGIFGLLVANMFGSRMNSEEISSYFWLLSGLLMSAVNMRRRGYIQ